MSIEHSLDGDVSRSASSAFWRIKPHRIFCEVQQADSEDYRALWAKLRSGVFSQGVYSRRRRDGSTLWLQANYNPIFKDGEVHRILKTATDVTKQVTLEHDVHDREAALQRTVVDLQAIVTTISASRQADQAPCPERHH